MSKLRKKIFVDAPVQGALARRIAIHWSIFSLLIAISVFTVEWFLGGAQSSFSVQLGQVWSKYGFFFLLMLASLPAFIYDTVKLSHRFTGPARRLHEALKQMADGKQVKPLKFREDDFWREVSEDFNRLAARLNRSAQINHHESPAEAAAMSKPAATV